MMPFEGGISSLGNGALILALAAAFAHSFIAGEAPNLRRTLAAAGPAIVFAALCVAVNGPARLSIALAAAAAGEALLAQKDERFRVATMIAFAVAVLALLWLLVGSLALALTVGSVTPRLIVAWLALAVFAAGAALPFLPGFADRLGPAVLPAARQLALIVISVAVLA